MLTTLFEQFLKEKQYLRGISPPTVKSYRQAIDRLKPGTSGIRLKATCPHSEFLPLTIETSLSG